MESPLPAIRAFNRTMARELGLAHEHYLGRPRPYGQSRLLFEIGRAGATVRELRSRLALDSGYLSRLLRALQGAGLVVVAEHAADRRTRHARLTALGRAELRALDRASDHVVGAWLAGLGPVERGRLAQCLLDARRLLLGARVRIEPVDPAAPATRDCLLQYFGELDRRFRGGFVAVRGGARDAADYRAPRGRFFLARLPSGEVLGCAGLRRAGEGTGEVKRMWVAPHARGAGVGRRLLAWLEQEARRQRLRRLRLDTNGALQEAMALYRAAGYREIPRYNDNPHAEHWYEKRLRPQRALRRAPGARGRAAAAAA